MTKAWNLSSATVLKILKFKYLFIYLLIYLEVPIIFYAVESNGGEKGEIDRKDRKTERPTLTLVGIFPAFYNRRYTQLVLMNFHLSRRCLIGPPEQQM